MARRLPSLVDCHHSYLVCAEGGLGLGLLVGLGIIAAGVIIGLVYLSSGDGSSRSSGRSDDTAATQGEGGKGGKARNRSQIPSTGRGQVRATAPSTSIDGTTTPAGNRATWKGRGTHDASGEYGSLRGFLDRHGSK